jgi:serine protease
MTDETTFERRSVLRGIGGTIALTGFAGHGAADGSDTEEVHIGIKGDATREEAAAEIADTPSIPDGAEIVHYNDAIDFAIVEVAKEPSVLSTGGGAVELLSEPSAIEYSESKPDPELCVVESQPAAVTPDDTGWDQQYGPQAVNADEVWEQTYGSDDVTVSIVDTGVDLDHPDLEDRVASDPGGDYQVGDRVSYDGSTWEATLASLNAEPGPNSAYWTEVN